MKYNNKAKRSLAAIAASFLLASSLGVTPAHSAQSGAEELLVKETISSASSLPNSDLQNAATLYLLLDLTYSLLENGNGGVRIYENGSEWLILRQAMKNLPETVKQVTTPLIDTIHSIERTPNGLVVTFVSGHSLTIAPEDDLEELSSKLKDIDTQDSSVKSISISPLQRLSDRINTIHRENGSDRFSPPWQPSKTPILPFTADGVKTDGASGVGGNGMKQKIIAFPQESYMSIADRLRSFMTSTQIQGELKKRPLNSLERINGFFDDYKKALEQYNHEGRVANLRAQGRNSEADHLETQRPGPLARTTLYRALVAGEWIEGPQKKWLLLLGDRDLADRLGPFMERSDIREELKTNLLNSIERINGFFDDYKKALEQYNHEGRVANLRAQDQDDKAGHLETKSPNLLARATLYKALVAGGWVRNPREGWQRSFGDRDRADRLRSFMTSTQIQGELKKRPLNSLERINGFFDDYKKALEQYNHKGRVANLRAQDQDDKAGHLETQEPGLLARTTLYATLVAGGWIENLQDQWLRSFGDRDRADRLRSFMTSTQIQGELKKRPLNSLERINGFFDDYKKALEQYNHKGRVANLRAQGRNSEADHLTAQDPRPLARQTLYKALIAGGWVKHPREEWQRSFGDRDLADRLGPFMERSDIREELKTNLLNSIERINGFFDDYKKALEQYNHEGRVANLRAQDQDDKAGHLETQEPGLLARATLYEALVAGGWVRNPREGWQRFFGDRDRAERLQPYFNDNWPYLDHGDDITWEMFREWYLEHRKPLSDFNYTALHSGQKRPEDSKDLTPRTIAMTLHVFQPFSATFLNQLRNYSGHLSYALAYEERLLSLLRTSLSSVRNQSSLSIYQLRRKYLAPNFQDAKLERTQSIQNLKAIVRLKQSWDDLLTGNSPSETLERDAFVSRIARKAHMTFKLSDKLWTYVENPDSYQPNYYQGAPLSNLITQFLVLDSAKELIQQWRDGELPQAADGVKTDGARVVGGNGMSVTVMRSDTVVSTISENKSQDVFSLTHSGRFRMIQTETTPRLHTQPPASLALVVDDSVNDPSLQDQSGNLDFFRFLKGHRRSIYTWSEWRAAYERGEVSETSVGFVLTNEHREELGALVGRRGEDLHWAKEHAHGSIDRFWIVPYHRLPRDVELLEQVREHGYKSLSGNWHDYLIDAVLGEVDNRPVEKGELMYIQEELNESADILFIQA